MLTKIYMHWIIEINGKSISINDLINKDNDRSEILILLKVITNVEQEFGKKLTTDELKTLTITLKKNEDGTLDTSLTGNPDVIKKVM